MTFFTSKRKSLFFLFILFTSLFFIKEVSAASIRGTVYDKDINPMKGVIIEINTTPIQKYVAKDGTYLFSLPLGSYNISAAFDSSTENLYAEEIINVEDNGKYLRDLFLKSIPKLEETTVNQDIKQITPFFIPIYITYAMYTGGVLLGLLIIGLSYFIIKKSKSHEQDKQEDSPEKKPIQESEKSELADLINLIKKNDGRMTQKDIRKEISLSEAKISLMISELEEKGTIKKIKKGRGNIIILNKK